jgi:hypothetical protein
MTRNTQRGGYFVRTNALLRGLVMVLGLGAYYVWHIAIFTSNNYGARGACLPGPPHV